MPINIISFLILLFWGIGFNYCQNANDDLLLKNVSFIDGTGTSLKRNYSILIKNGIFDTIVSTSDLNNLKTNTKIIDLDGKTIIPGIIGMHNHLHIPQFPNIGRIASKLYLASGVTTIQTCGATNPEDEISLARRIEKGEEIGPEIIPSGPFITGSGGNRNMIIPKNRKHLRDTMQYYINQGIRWFKVYRNIEPEDLEYVIDIAHDKDCKIRGHLCSVTFEEASKLGINGIEHGFNSLSDFKSDKTYGACNGSRVYIDSLNIESQEVRSLLQTMIDKKVFMTSTLSIYEASIPNRAFADPNTLPIMSPYLKELYKSRKAKMDKMINNNTREKRLKRIMRFEYLFYKMGGLLCSGVDAGRHVLPGFGDLRNYELLIEAGFKTEEAIQIMTGNGAKALDRTDIGTIEIGKRADFVILDGDLLNKSSTIRKIDVVYKKGIAYYPIKILKNLKGKYGIE
ncbi:MAG: amidohydrolase [Aquimarina sp.]|nr:amidohydrolase [Aquimarina sp.]